MSAVYATRKASAWVTNGDSEEFEIDTQRPKTESYALTAGLTADLPRSWQIRLDGGYSHIDVARTVAQLTSEGVSSSRTDFTDSALTTLNAVADGPLFAIGGGDVSLAIGAIYQAEKYDLLAGSVSIGQNRKVRSAFGEVVVLLFSPKNNVPEFELLQLSAAIRHDSYSDFGGTTNPKFGALWEPIAGLRFSGTYGRSFRAPAFRDLYGQDVNAAVFGINFPTNIGPPPLILIDVIGGN